MALFSWKKSDDQGEAAKPPAPEAPAQFSPDKAKRFFDHARTVDETSNYEYAVQSWLNGLRLDPTSMVGLEGFFASIAKFLGESDGKKGVSKDVVRSISGKTDIDRYLLSLLEWGQKPQDAGAAVRAFEHAARLGLRAPARWIGERALGLCAKDKPRKDLLIKLTDGFEKIEAFDRAVVAAEAAGKADPTDGQLVARVRSLAAQATMTRGGFDQAGQAGGFRANIRDQSKQRQLEDAERITKTAETVERLIAAAEDEHNARPNDLPTIERLAKLLIERGTTEDEERAHALYSRSHADSKQFRYRELAGDIRLKQARRRAQGLKQALDGGDASKAGELEDALRALGGLEVTEHKLRVEAYPTDLVRKYELGKRLYMNEQFEDAIPMFQESQGEPRYRAPSMAMLAQCFLRVKWVDEAIETFRRALELRDIPAETTMELQYGLMVALQNKGEGDRDLTSAEEAEKLASSIAIRQITYKDVRVRREALKRLVAQLKTGAQPA